MGCTVRHILYARTVLASVLVVLAKAAHATGLLDNAPVAPTELAPFIDHLTEHMEWMTRFQPADTVVPQTVLPSNSSTRGFSRIFRTIGRGILPQQQRQLELLAKMLTFLCERLISECRIFQIAGWPMLEHTYEDLLAWHGQDHEAMCGHVCMVQVHPTKEQLTKCPACAKAQPEPGFEPYQAILTLFEFTVTRKSLFPLALRTMMSRTSLSQFMTTVDWQAGFPELEQHVIHNAALASHVFSWHQVAAVSLMFQIFGPSVVPFTAGKAGLLVSVVRDLEGETTDIHQHYRITKISNSMTDLDELHPHANVTLVILRSKTNRLQGLDKVLLHGRQQLQEGLISKGLPVTQLILHGPSPCPGETIQDQIAAMRPFWQRVRHKARTLRPVAETVTAAACAAVVLVGMLYVYQWQRGMVLMSQEIWNRWCHNNNDNDFTTATSGQDSRRQLKASVARRCAEAGQLSVWQGESVSVASLEVCMLADGSPWLLGQGSFGCVYKAIWQGRQIVAVKVMAADLNKLALGALKKEIKIMRSLPYNSNIVGFYGACVDDRYPMLVLEYMEGGDLHSCIQQDTWPTPKGELKWHGKGAGIARGVARGLAFLHEQKVTHNDIKSSNILLNKDATVAKIADVGTSRIAEVTHSTPSLPGLGTFAYAAPEQLMGQRDVCTNKVDMFSFGVVLWEIVTQERPRRGDLRITRVPQECPEAVEDLISACVSLQPDQRPSAIQAFNILSSLVT